MSIRTTLAGIAPSLAAYGPCFALALTLTIAASTGAAAQQQEVKPGDFPRDNPAPANDPPPLPDTGSGAGADLAGALDTLGQTFAPGEADAFAAYLANGAPPGVTGDTFGHLLFARRHFDRAAWFFGTEAQADPGRAASLSNFAAMMAMTYEDAGPGAPDAWRAAALAAARDAATLAPNVAEIQNNLGNVARLAGDLETAVAAGRRATELAPDEPLYWTNLARTLAAAGDSAGAAAALARAHLLEPNGLALLETVTAVPSASGAYSQALGAQCQVNFRCQEICPRSIIGGLMSVTCEIENSSAQLACQAGQPYPISYDCREDLPEYGILIPGLNSGFSVAVPGLSVHVIVQGDGSIDTRVEAGVSVGPVSAYLRGDGHYSPTNGASFDNLGSGVRVNLLPNSPANQLASDLGHPPVHIEAEALNGAPLQINVETYNAGLIAY